MTTPQPPVIGSPCPSSGSIWIGAEGLFVPVANAAKTGFVWARAGTLQDGATIPGRTLVPGGFITFSPPLSQDAQRLVSGDALMLDILRPSVLHYQSKATPPVVGSVCEDRGAALLSDALYLCRDTDAMAQPGDAILGNGYGHWVRVPIQTTPEVVP